MLQENLLLNNSSTAEMMKYSNKNASKEYGIKHSERKANSKKNE